MSLLSEEAWRTLLASAGSIEVSIANNANAQHYASVTVLRSRVASNSIPRCPSRPQHIYVARLTSSMTAENMKDNCQEHHGVSSTCDGVYYDEIRSTDENDWRKATIDDDALSLSFRNISALSVPTWVLWGWYADSRRPKLDTEAIMPQTSQ
eukprot:2993893-Pleurochrysis_carterae.AAC.9